MQVIKNIIRYQLRKKTLVYYTTKNDNTYYFVDNNLKKVRDIKVSECHWFLDDENYLVNGYNNHLLLGYYEDGIFKHQLTKNYRPVVYNVGVTYDYSNSDGQTNQQTLFRLPEETQILSEWLPNSIRHIQDQYWINDTLEDLKLIDADKGEILWSIKQPKVERPYEYDGITSIKKVLGIYKNNLWLQLPDGRLLVLDIKTGEITKEISHENFEVYEKGICMDTESGQLIIFSFNLYAIYDINTEEFIENIKISNSEEFYISNMEYKSGDKYIYFCGNQNDNNLRRWPNVYGIFDKEQKKVVFQGNQIEEDGFFFSAPQVNDDLFTILDSEENLIIHKLKDILP